MKKLLMCIAVASLAISVSATEPKEKPPVNKKEIVANYLSGKKVDWTKKEVKPFQVIQGCHASPYWRNMYYALALMSVVQYTVDEAYTWETTHADPESNQTYYCYEIKYH